jgi:hypothetical protein
MTAIVVLVILVALIAAGMAVLKRRAQRAAGTGAAAGKRPNIDPFTVGEPWRRHLSSALSSERRFNEIVRGVDAGPLRDRLTSIGGQVHRGVGELFAIAKRGDDLDTAIGRIDSSAINRQLGASADDSAAAALQSQLDAVGRMKATRDRTDQQLRTMNLRLGELVAQAAEVSIGGSGSAELGTALDDLVQQMEALRLAVADVEAVRKGVTMPVDLALPDAPGPAAPTTAEPPAPSPVERPDEPGSAAAST